MIAQLNPLYLKTRFWKLWPRLIAYIFFEGRPITTSHRWINPILFFLFNLEKKIPSLRKVKKPIFIIGVGRSGTTILGMALSMHKEIGYLNEPKALWHSIYPNEDIIGNYSQADASYRLDEKNVSQSTIKSAHRLLGSFLTTSFASRLLDKYPELIFRVPFVKAIFPDAKFLFIVRNGWDTCSSINLWSERLGVNHEGKVHDWWGVNRRKWKFMVEQLVAEDEELSRHAKKLYNWNSHQDMAAVEWILTMREGLRLLELYPKDVLRVDYELLCQDPIAGLKNITDFTELSSSDKRFYKYGKTIFTNKPRAEKISLHPLIESAFLKTMSDLGYQYE